MKLTDWNKIKGQIYYWDGSLRDIYVLGTTHEDWGKWIDLINEKYAVAFEKGQTAQLEAAINKEIVFEYFNGTTDLLNIATITLGNTKVKCYFFTSQEIENDIDPREVETIEDHQRLMSYLLDVSKALDKTVVLTAENQQETVYISVYGDNVELYLK